MHTDPKVHISERKKKAKVVSKKTTAIAVDGVMDFLSRIFCSFLQGKRTHERMHIEVSSGSSR